MQRVKAAAKRFLANSDVRYDEYRFTRGHIKPSDSLLDAGSGTGTFITYMGNKTARGIDINPENVEHCRANGIQADVGSILEMPYEDNSFDVTHCSHVMQVFDNNDAVQMLKELARVTKPGGKVIIATLNWFPRFFRHPENVRAYPPDVFWRYFATQDGVSSPMYPGIPACTVKDIWLRRPPLVEFDFSVNKNVAGAGAVFNAAQYRLWLRKFWSYQAYVIVLEKQ